jgi:hypothetical protein
MPAVQLEQFLTKEEAAGLRRMAEVSPEWTFLLKLLSLLEQVAQQELVGFKGESDAFEKRGYVRGVAMVREIIRNLYDTRNADNLIIGGSNGSPSNSREAPGATAGEEARSPSSFAY